MTETELKSFKWEEVSFAQQESKKIIILICSTMESADSLLEALKTDSFDLRVIIREPLKTFSLRLIFKQRTFYVLTQFSQRIIILL
jgi:hypothetical protein